MAAPEATRLPLQRIHPRSAFDGKHAKLHGGNCTSQEVPAQCLEWVQYPFRVKQGDEKRNLETNLCYMWRLHSTFLNSSHRRGLLRSWDILLFLSTNRRKNKITPVRSEVSHLIRAQRLRWLEGLLKLCLSLLGQTLQVEAGNGLFSPTAATQCKKESVLNSSLGDIDQKLKCLSGQQSTSPALHMEKKLLFF